MAIILVSPIVPDVRPITISSTFTLSPAFNAAKGVAPVYASQVKSVMITGNEIKRKHLAAKAGFIKFFPNPPYKHFAIKIAKAEPIITIHKGIAEIVDTLYPFLSQIHL